MDKYSEAIRRFDALENSAPDDQDRWVKPTTVRERLGISPRTLERWLRDETKGFPQPFRVNGRRFFSELQLRAFMKGAAELK
jgi:hypothetical protein